MINLQQKYKDFFGGICYAFCICKKFRPDLSDQAIALLTLQGWNEGFLDDDGYIIPKSSLICKWIDEEYLKSTYDNMKAVAYMLDINQWNILFG